MKKNILLVIVAILGVMSMTSCGSLMGNSYGYGYNRPAETGIIGTAIQNKMGCWSNDGARITETKATATKGLYYVTCKGVSDFYYLQPLSEAVKGLPYGVKIISSRPYWNTFYDQLSWMFHTTGGNILVLNNGKYVPCS